VRRRALHSAASWLIDPSPPVVYFNWLEKAQETMNIKKIGTNKHQKKERRHSEDKKDDYRVAFPSRG
jgi:hypothetical protein